MAIIINVDDKISAPRTEEITPDKEPEIIPEKTVTESIGSMFESFKSGFSLENTIASRIKFGANDSYRDNPDYDSFNLIRGTQYEKYADRFIYADSDDEVRDTMARIDNELGYRNTAATNTWSGVLGSMAGGVLDPTVLIPAGGAIKVVKAGMAARTAVRAAEGSALAVGAVAAQEAQLHQTQLTRTMEESAINVAAAGVFGGVLGGIVGSLSKNAKVTGEATTKMTLEGSQPTVNLGGPRSAGAADATISALDGETFANIPIKGVKGLAGTLRIPVLRGAASDNLATKELTNMLFKHNFRMKKNYYGQGSEVSVQSLMELDDARHTLLFNDVKSDYLDMVGIKRTGYTADMEAVAKSAVGSIKSHTWFSEELSKAMRRGDSHEIPQIQKAAQRIRAEMNDALKKMQDLELITKDIDVKTATSYLSRKWNIKKIIEDEGTNRLFRGKVSDYFSRVNPDMEGDELETLVENTIRNIIGLGDSSLQLADFTTKVATKSGKFTKQRTFLIPDSEIEDFLVNDGLGISGAYLKQASALIRLNEKLKEHGYDSILDVKKQLADESMQRKKYATTPQESTKIDTDARKDLKFIDDSVSAILGQSLKPGGADSLLKTIRTYNILSKLGGVVLSSIPDLGGSVFILGLPRALRASFASVFHNASAVKMAKDELKYFNVGLEIESSSVLKAVSDPDMSLGKLPSSFDRVSGEVLRFYGKATGLDYWNNMNRRWIGYGVQSRILEELKGWEATGVMPEKSMIRLAQYGIGIDDYKKVLDNFNKYGEEIDGVLIPHVNLWDTETFEKFGTAVMNETDSAILRPSKGDLPFLWQSSELAKTATQFKSFVMAATSRIVVSGLQRRDSEALQGIIAMIALGTMSYTIKEKVAGRTPNLDPLNLAIEGISRSGITGLLGDAVFSLNPWYRASRFTQYRVEGFLLGPSASLIRDSYGTFIGSLADGELSEKELKKMGQFLPFQNLFYLRILLNKVFGDDKDDGK